MGQIRCPACGESITADEAPPTKVVPCPRCGLQMLVPTPPPEAPVPPASPELQARVLNVVGAVPMSLEAVAAALGQPADRTLEGLLIALTMGGKLAIGEGGFRRA